MTTTSGTAAATAAQNTWPQPEPHVVLVAIEVEVHAEHPATREQAERHVHTLLGAGADYVEHDGVTASWWIAEDDRCDGSDNDSAVFVRHGLQIEAHDVLQARHLTGPYNDPALRRR